MPGSPIILLAGRAAVENRPARTAGLTLALGKQCTSGGDTLANRVSSLASLTQAVVPGTEGQAPWTAKVAHSRYHSRK